MGYTFPVQDVDDAEVSFNVPSGPGNRDDFANNGRVQMILRNDDASDHTVTVYAQRGCSPFGIKHDLTYTVSAGKTRVVMQLDAYVFNNQFGRVEFDCSSATSFGVALLRTSRT